MSSVEHLRGFVNERLTAAAEEIFGVFQKTAVEYEEEIDRLRKLLEIVLKPEAKLHRLDLSQQHACYEEEEAPPTDQQLCDQERNSSLDPEDPDPPQIKEEQEELCISQEGEQLVLKQEADTFTLTPTCADSGDQTLLLNPDGTGSAAQTESVVNMSVIKSVVSEANSELQQLNNSDEAESRGQTRGKHEDSESAGGSKDERDKSPTDNSTMFTTHINTHRGINTYICDFCGKDFKTMTLLRTHLMTHTGKMPFECETCGKGFRTSTNMKRHLRVHTGEKPYVCKTCGKGFSMRASLNRHAIRVHTGERPYVCKTCGKNFSIRASLNIHLRVHTGEKPYLCKICGKSFSFSSTLTKHLKIHTGEKPHICNMCGKRFIDVSNLKRHTRVHTGEKPYVCVTCGRDFTKRVALSVHMTKAHPDQRPHSQSGLEPEPPQGAGPLHQSEGGPLEVKQETESISVQHYLYTNILLDSGCPPLPSL